MTANRNETGYPEFADKPDDQSAIDRSAMLGRVLCFILTVVFLAGAIWLKGCVSPQVVGAAEIQMSKHFSKSEFACHHCGETKVNMQVIIALEELREMLGSPIVITSAYRCPKHNRAVGGARNSQHLYGNAVDIKIKGYTPREVEDAAKICGFTWTKVYKNFTHIDVRLTAR